MVLDKDDRFLHHRLGFFPGGRLGGKGGIHTSAHQRNPKGECVCAVHFVSPGLRRGRCSHREAPSSGLLCYFLAANAELSNVSGINSRRGAIIPAADRVTTSSRASSPSIRECVSRSTPLIAASTSSTKGSTSLCGYASH